MRYIKFFKPYEVLCQFTDAQGRQTLKNYIGVAGIYSAGRLDFRSEGLLILTNDGQVIQRLTDPIFDHPKTYLVQVEGLLTESASEALMQLNTLNGDLLRPLSAQLIQPPVLPARSKPVRPYHPTSWMKIVLKEGKKHQIRLLTASIGFPTLRLVRVAIGGITIDGLEPGQWRDLSTQELTGLKQSLGLG
jgi:23S rRNA pseudouridine2457 synthase